MPSGNTFTIKPIKELLSRWLAGRLEIVDPFARDSSLANWTNDLNPDTTARYHLHYRDFFSILTKNAVTPDAALLDPPYSPRQISEIYKSIGRSVTAQDTQNARMYAECKDFLSGILKPGGVAICFGWNSVGFGKTRGMELEEVLIVAHGEAHNDTIVTVETKKGN